MGLFDERIAYKPFEYPAKMAAEDEGDDCVSDASDYIGMSIDQFQMSMQLGLEVRELLNTLKK